MQKVQYVRSGLPDDVPAHGGWTRTSHELTNPEHLEQLRRLFVECHNRAEQSSGVKLAPIEIVELTDERHRTTHDGKPCFAYGWRALVA